MTFLTVALLAAAQLAAPVPESSRACVECHSRERIAATSMETWRTSRHANVGVGCADCHLAPGGDDQKSLCPAPGVHREVAAPACGSCHPQQAEQFALGRHAQAWTALERVRQELPDLTASATRGCELCHRIGASGGRCDYCHTRHAFDPAEARRPESCRACHQGANHPEWDMFSLSRHGSLYTIAGDRWDWSHRIDVLYGDREPQVEHPPRVPVCTTCHMARGDHEVPSVDGAALLGFASDNAEWLADEAVIRRHFGLPNRPVTVRTSAASSPAVDSPDPLTGAFPGLLAACGGCHTRSFAVAQITVWQQDVREADRLTAEAVRAVDRLRADGLVPSTAVMPRSIDEVDLVDPAASVEARLWRMVLTDRVRLVLGIFHQDPDYGRQQGWSDLRADLRAITDQASALRATAAKGAS